MKATYNVRVYSNSGYREYDGFETRRKSDIINAVGRYEDRETIDVIKSKTGKIVYRLVYFCEKHRYCNVLVWEDVQ